jgi:hypothetical protein
MTKKIALTMSAAAVAGFLLLPPSAEAGRIRRRGENQQDRIAQGIGSGALAPREAAQLERREGHLNHEVRDMREDNGGTLTKRERLRVDRQQNRLSRGIYRQKHDAQVQPH